MALSLTNKNVSGDGMVTEQWGPFNHALPFDLLFQA